MVSLNCDCKDRLECKINSNKLFEEINDFFITNVQKGIFKEIPITKPYYIGFSDNKKYEWFADKWYKCSICGQIWAINYPDFPAQGVVYKLDHNYNPYNADILLR